MERQKSNYRKKPQHTPVITDPSGKLQPQAVELEEAVLGALMLEKDAYTIVSDLLTPESFYEPRYQKIYEAINQLGFNQRPIDMLTVTEQLRQNGTLEEVGGAVFITELTARVQSAAHIEYHARIIAQKSLARRLITFTSHVQTKAFDEANDIDDLLQEAEGALFEISQTQLKRDVTQIDPVIGEAIRQIQLAANNKSGLSGLATGFNDLDKVTSGWQRSDLIIIAARPAMGKTAFVLSMAKNMAVDLNTPVAIFSLEMSNVQLVNRLISNVCEIEGEKIKSGRLSDMEWDQLNTRIKNLYQAPLYIDDTPSLSISELRTKARRLVREACSAPDAEVMFLVGGTQTNAVAIDGILRRHEGVLAAESGHIAVHESGAIEASGMLSQATEKLIAFGRVGSLVGDRPNDYVGTVLVAADHVGELAFGVLVGLRVGPCNGPVYGYL